MAYCTVEEVKAELEIPDENTSEDAFIEERIKEAQQAIERTTNRLFEAEDSTRSFDVNDDVFARDDRGRRSLWLDADLCAITSITNGDGDTFAPSDYVTEPRNQPPYFAISIRSDASVVWTYSSHHENAISITGKWAYSAEAPYDVRRACIRLAAWMYRQKGGGGEADRTIITPDGVRIQPMAFPKDVQTLLAPFVKRVY